MTPMLCLSNIVFIIYIDFPVFKTCVLAFFHCQESEEKGNTLQILVRLKFHIIHFLGN